MFKIFYLLYLINRFELYIYIQKIAEGGVLMMFKFNEINLLDK